MTVPAPQVAIVLISFNSEPYIQDVFSSLRKTTYPKDRLELVIVDNPHPELGSSMRYLQEQVLPLSGQDLPHITLLPQTTNTGFSGGCNAGLRWAMEHDFDYALLHNQDGFLTANALETIVSALEQDKTIGAAQCLLLLHPETELINSAGNAFHYLGLGYCNHFRVPKNTLTLAPVSDVSYASGAALLMRVDLLKKYGGLDDEFFLYHEDLAYSLRLKVLGYRIVLVRDAVFYHKYSFGRYRTKFYYMERNRIGTLLIFYKLPTLLLILPLFILLEAGLFIFAWKEGWLKEKLSVYRYWLTPSNWGPWLKKRRTLQAIRTRTDRELLADAVGRVTFEEKRINNVMLRYLGNPLMHGYWKIIKPLIQW